MLQDIISLFYNGQYDDVEMLCRLLMEEYPNEAMLFEIGGLAASRRGDMIEAIKWLERAYELRPDLDMMADNLVAVSFSFGAHLSTHQDYEGALPYLERVISLRPNYPNITNAIASALSNVGLSRYGHGRYSEAIPYLERALVMSSGRAEVINDVLFAAYNCHGYNLSANCEHEEAARCFERALSIMPGQVDTINNLSTAYDCSGIVLCEAGRQEDAASYFERALALRPHCSTIKDHLFAVLSHLGIRSIGSGKFDDALFHLERAHGLKPDKDEWNLGVIPYYVACLLYHGRLNDAKNIVLSLIDIGNYGENLSKSIFNTVESFMDRGRNVEASEILGKMIGHDIASSDDYINAYYQCSIGIADFCESLRLISMVLGCTRETRTSALIKSILKFDNDSIGKLYASYIKWDTTHSIRDFYRSITIDTFYFKVLFHRIGASCNRRQRSIEKSCISVSSIARKGRFANVLCDYLTARLYADLHDLELETPEWLGQYFFELDDPGISQGVDKRIVLDAGSICQLFDDRDQERAHVPLENSDIESPFANIFQQRFKDKIRELTIVREPVRRIFDKSIEYLHRFGKSIICIHIRLGDLGSGDDVSFGGIHYSAYLNWLDENFHKLESPVLYVASDDVGHARARFDKYSPITLTDIPDVLPVGGQLLDFYIMLRSDALLISRGGFGRTAAALREVQGHAYRPSSDGLSLVSFDPWAGE